jgi:PTS system nitrogen regulatory IIA component
MNAADLLQPAHALINVRTTDKTALIQDLATRAAAALELPAERISAELLKREALGSTGTGGAIAIPHARMPELKKPFGMLVRLQNPVDFNAIDGNPVDIVFLLLLPGSSQTDPLNTLASIMRKLRNPETAQRLRRAADGSELHRAMVESSETKRPRQVTALRENRPCAKGENISPIMARSTVVGPIILWWRSAAKGDRLAFSKRNGATRTPRGALALSRLCWQQSLQGFL